MFIVKADDYGPSAVGAKCFDYRKRSCTATTHFAPTELRHSAAPMPINIPSLRDSEMTREGYWPGVFQRRRGGDRAQIGTHTQ